MGHSPWAFYWYLTPIHSREKTQRLLLCCLRSVAALLRLEMSYRPSGSIRRIHLKVRGHALISTVEGIATATQSDGPKCGILPGCFFRHNLCEPMVATKMAISTRSISMRT